MTFSNSLISKAVVMRQVRGCDEGHWHAHTKGLLWDLPEVVWTVQQMYCIRRRLHRGGLDFHGCTINKSAHTRKVWNLYVPAKLDNKLPQNIKYMSWIHKLYRKKNMKTLRLKLTAGRRNLGEANHQRGIFQGDALSPLLIIITMMPSNHIFRKCTAGYKLSQSQEKSNHLIYMDDIKHFAKKWKTTTKSDKRCENIQSGHGGGRYRKIVHTSNEKR